jgi:teichuronic acid biosynthesis glycosyltransferase TuaC
LGLPMDKVILFFPADPKLTVTKGYPLLSQSITYLSPVPLLLTGGSIPHHDMPLYMNAADAVALTSNYEASPMVVKEAMACNTPITATDAGDIKMIFEKTEGYNIAEKNPSDFAEKLKKTIAFGMKTKGRDRIVSLGLSLEEVGKKYIRLYERLVQS